MYSGKEEYGFGHLDKRVDNALEEIFEDTLRYDPPRDKASVPLHLLLALKLRRKSGRLPKISIKEHRERARFRADLREQAQRREPGETKTGALLRVAENGAKAFAKTFNTPCSETTMKRWLESKPRARR